MDVERSSAQSPPGLTDYCVSYIAVYTTAVNQTVNIVWNSAGGLEFSFCPCAFKIFKICYLYLSTLVFMLFGTLIVVQPLVTYS